MATSIYTNKYPIPEGFHDILHNFIKETIRAQPKDILDFGIQYFSKLELNQDPTTINTKKISMNFPSGETSTINTKSNFYENNTQIQFNQNVENPIHEKISDENSPILTNENNEQNNYRPNSRLTTMSVNSTIKNDAREFIGNVLTESKIMNSNKIKNESKKNVENEENNENNNENVENEENQNEENNENQNENENENEENNENENEGYEIDDENNNENNENNENNNNINESINSQNKSNPSYSVTSTQKNDAKEFVEDVVSESKKSL
jgi:hypothetical protein